MTRMVGGVIVAVLVYVMLCWVSGLVITDIEHWWPAEFRFAVNVRALPVHWWLRSMAVGVVIAHSIVVRRRRKIQSRRCGPHVDAGN